MTDQRTTSEKQNNSYSIIYTHDLIVFQNKISIYVTSCQIEAFDHIQLLIQLAVRIRPGPQIRSVYKYIRLKRNLMQITVMFSK